MHIILVLKKSELIFPITEKKKSSRRWNYLVADTYFCQPCQCLPVFSYCWNFKRNYSINLNKVIFSLRFNLENGIYDLWERGLQNTFNHLFLIYSRYFLKPWSIFTGIESQSLQLNCSNFNLCNNHYFYANWMPWKRE